MALCNVTNIPRVIKSHCEGKRLREQWLSDLSQTAMMAALWISCQARILHLTGNYNEGWIKSTCTVAFSLTIYWYSSIHCLQISLETSHYRFPMMPYQCTMGYLHPGSPYPTMSCTTWPFASKAAHYKGLRLILRLHMTSKSCLDKKRKTCAGR